MNKKNIRTNIWKKLQKVAKPDSRFHFNFEEYIPDFIESENAHKQIYEDKKKLSIKYLLSTKKSFKAPCNMNINCYMMNKEFKYFNE